MERDTDPSRQSDQRTTPAIESTPTGGFWTETPAAMTTTNAPPTQTPVRPAATTPPPARLPPTPPEDPLFWVRSHPGTVIGLALASLFSLLLLVLLIKYPLLWVVLFWMVFLIAIPTTPILILVWPEIVRRQQVIDRWDTLIAGGQGQAERVIIATTELLTALQLPQIALQQTDLSPSIFKRLAGTKRPFLVVSQTTNFNLQPYRVYVNVRDYGESLQTSWYLTFQPGLLQRLRMIVLRRTNSLMLDLFDEQDLRAYVTAVHQCFIQAVLELLETLGQDNNTLNRTSKGFLGIS